MNGISIWLGDASVVCVYITRAGVICLIHMNA